MSDIDSDPESGDGEEGYQLPEALLERKKQLDAREALPPMPEEIQILNQKQPMYGVKLVWNTEESLDLELGASAYSEDGKLLGVLNADTRGLFHGNFRIDPDFKMPDPVEPDGDDGEVSGDPEPPPEPEENGEIIKINLNNIPGAVRTVYFWLAGFDRGKMDAIPSYTVTITDVSTGETECTFSVDETTQNQTMLVAASLFRTPDSPNLWELHRQRKFLSYNEFEDSAPWFETDAKSRPALPIFPLSKIQIQRQVMFGGCGRTLHPKHQSMLRTAMVDLQLSRRLVNLSYWGTIYAETDYTILVSTEVTSGISKRFFYSAGSPKQFFELPVVDAFVNKFAPLVEGAFKGKPSDRCVFPTKKKRTADDDDDDADDDDDDDSDLGLDPNDAKLSLFPDFPTRKLFEYERLSYVVRTIDHKTCLVPTGRYAMNNIANIVTSKSFGGLTLEQAQNMQNYQYFRNPIHIQTLRKLRGMRVTSTTDFLDDLSQPQPMKGLWSLQLNFARTHVCLRSLYCPGAEFQMELGSPDNFSSSYHGNGLLNNSLVFMLPEL